MQHCSHCFAVTRNHCIMKRQGIHLSEIPAEYDAAIAAIMAAGMPHAETQIAIAAIRFVRATVEKKLA